MRQLPYCMFKNAKFQLSKPNWTRWIFFLRRIKESTIVQSCNRNPVHSNPFIGWTPTFYHPSGVFSRNVAQLTTSLLAKSIRQKNERTNEDAPRNFFGAATRKCFHFYESDMRKQIQLIPTLVSIMWMEQLFPKYC